MARRPRIDFPGVWHHVMHRGAHRAPIFRGDDDLLRFLGVKDARLARRCEALEEDGASE